MSQIFITLMSFGNLGLLALRLAVGSIFWAHGRSKKGMWKMQPSDQMPAAMISKIRILSVCEPLGALAMFFGFLTPFAAVGLGIIMLGAMYYKIKVWKAPFMGTEKLGWELDLLVLAACLALLFLGPGSIALDALLWK